MRDVDQVAVRAALAAVGGYWRPSAGVLRLLEELGEVAAAHQAEDRDALGDELADVWIISTAIADQFLVDVRPLRAADSSPAEAFPHAGGPATLPAASGAGLADLVAHAGEIARVVNYYDGPKAPRTLDGWRGLAPAVAALHGALGQVAAAHGIQLGARVTAKLTLLTSRDEGRFAFGYDASTAPVLSRLRYAHPELNDARLIGGPDWDDINAERAVATAKAIAAIEMFCKAADHEQLDGLVMAGPPGATAVGLHRWWTALLTTAAQEGVMLDPGWAAATLKPATEVSGDAFVLVLRRAGGYETAGSTW